MSVVTVEFEMSDGIGDGRRTCWPFLAKKYIISLHFIQLTVDNETIWQDVHVWDVAKADKKPVHVFKSIHHGHVECLIWLSADKIATCSNGGHIKISQLGNSQALYEMKSAKGVRLY